MAILDFEKAFDKVAHNRLIHKLYYYGIRGDLLQWIQSFLTNRTQRVVVDGICSSPCSVTSDHCWVVLFLIYVNDITSNIHSQLRLFADDCLIYRPINSPEDHKIFQDDLFKLSKWADAWQMKFNVKKYCILLVSTLHSTSNFTYTMYNILLQVVEQHHYLGVLLDNKLSWTPHICSISNKANCLIGFLCRNLHHCPPHLKERAYKQIVLPTIEYCSTIWDPYQQISIHKLEMIQHRAARFV